MKITKKFLVIPVLLWVAVWALVITPYNFNKEKLSSEAVSTSPGGSFGGFNFDFILRDFKGQWGIGAEWTPFQAPYNLPPGYLDQLYYNFQLDGYDGQGPGHCLERAKFITDPTEKAKCLSGENQVLFKAGNAANRGVKNVLIKNATIMNAFRTFNAVGGVGNEYQEPNGWGALPHIDTFFSGWETTAPRAGWMVIQDSVIKNSDHGIMQVGNTDYTGVVYQNLSNYCDGWWRSDENARNLNDLAHYPGSNLGGGWNAAGCDRQLTVGAQRVYGSVVWLINVLPDGNPLSPGHILIENPNDSHPNQPVIVVGNTNLNIVTRHTNWNLPQPWGDEVPHANVHYFSFIEDAIDAGYAKPPYVELSCSGWKHPPAGCTPASNRGYLNGTAPTDNTLYVSKTGSGTVTGSGINCGDGGTTCSKSYTKGSNISVTLHAEPSTGAAFTGWSGGTCSGALPDCTFTMSTDDRSVIANFTNGPAQTATVNSISGATSIQKGSTYPITVNYTSSFSGTMIVELKKGDATVYTSANVSAPAGTNQSITANITVPASLSAAPTDELNYTVYVTTTGGSWSTKPTGSMLLTKGGIYLNDSTTQPTTHTVTASAGSNGSISPTIQTINNNTTTTFTVTPNSGYTIANVSGCSGTLNGSIYTTGNITSDCTVTANFALNSATETVAIHSISGPTSIQKGNTYTVTVNYDSSFNGDMLVQLKQGDGNVYVDKRIAITAGTGKTITVVMTIPSTTPTTPAALKYFAFVTQTGKNWADKVGDAKELVGISATETTARVCKPW